jgi:hypothetical protein
MGLVMSSPGVMYDEITEEMENAIVKILYYFLLILPYVRRMCGDTCGYVGWL